MNMRRVILASGSPRRFDLLKSVLDNFEVITSNYEEDMTLDMKPSELVKFLSKGKADEVAQREKGIILGADTIVVLNGKVIGKPKSKEEAKETLKALSNNSHHVYTGFTIIDTENNKEIIDFEKTEIIFKELSDEKIEEYIKTGEPMDKAGAYGIQGLAKEFILKYNGSYNNIVGLPIEKVKEHLISLEIL